MPFNFDTYITKVRFANPSYNSQYSANPIGMFFARSDLTDLNNLLERIWDRGTPATPAECTRVRELIVAIPVSRKQKYMDALIYLVDEMAVRPRPEGLRAPTPLQAIRRICYRGDTREPAVIFAAGFAKQAPDSEARYRGSDSLRDFGFTPPELAGIGKAGDMDPVTAVCLSTDFAAATMFPLKDAARRIGNPPDGNPNVYVYAVHVERAYNTSARQVMDALKNWDELSGRVVTLPIHRQVAVGTIGQNLFGREVATEGILPNQVLCGVRVQRIWRGVSMIPAVYRLEQGAVPNPNITDPVVRLVRDRAVAAINELGRQWRHMITSASGFHASERR